MADPHTAPGVRVPLIEESEASGRTAELYALVKQATGLPFVPDMFRLASTRPDLLEVVLTGFTGMFGGGVLPRETKEIISAWTSRVNSCPYCVGTHNYFLRLFGGPAELTEAIETAASPDELPVDERTRQLLHLVTKVSTAAYRITDADWERTEAAGWTNEEVLEAVFCAALFNFINRLVDGLGLGTSVTESRISRQTID
ncbi:carboxymuconolactone decarboxylase family protein [Nocardia terpenica]|uniref:Peroxidase n=1 Tax=Nocardia terpenica TaxID=455432 RepID=A0A164MD94_9NOCA|nr:carboxymuconolactone decarboxylase family protein [Nocardia terpenica]ATL67444.1 peroxidase [Nocardia terpenica]KZM73254.1 peroxidase [Nocardia terpenica]MBF6064137.1 carboxymuconolactone decarboxylase family protein [Nocardia terpenica]MBF6106470.1 carboxymuconolactone decarboxylase family protein [Nocardia terpenica]MBF6113755.1 carboxymuconolactone decarboxylase family protein [Nocardia terpenica]